MRESRPYGSVRGDRGNPVPYRVRIKPAVEGRGSVRNDPAAERNFLSSVQCAGRRHVGEVAHGVGDAVPDRFTTVIVLRRKFIGARCAFLDGLPYRLSIMLVARQISILGITPETLQESSPSIVIFITCLL